MIDALNSWAVIWLDWVLTVLLEGTLMLSFVGVAWRVAARRAPSQFGYLLFLLVLLRFALPIAVVVPAGWEWLSPRNALGRAMAWLGEDSAKKPSGLATMLEANEREASELDADWLAAHADLLPAHAESNGAAMLPKPARSLSLSASLMLSWATVGAVLLMRLLWEQVKWARRFAVARALDVATLPMNYAALCRRAGLRRSVTLIESSDIESPAVWGLFRPRLVMPTGLAERLPRKQLAWVLAHELAHLRRGDLWVVLMQRLLQIVFFFHPAVWLANRTIDRLREYACDDAALVATGCAGRECGSALVSVAAWALRSRPQPILGLFSSPSLLKQRVTRLISVRPDATLRLSPTSLAALAIAALLVLPHVRAAEPTSPMKSSAKTQTKRKALRTETNSDLTEVRREDNQRRVKTEPPEGAHLLKARTAAIKAIRRARGSVAPDLEKLRSMPGTFVDDPRNDFIGVTLSPNRPVATALEHLASLPELKRLNLTATSVVDEELAYLQSLNNLSELRLDATAITDDGLSRLAGLKTLQELSLSKTMITSNGIEKLMSLANLRRLELDHLEVDDESLRYLGSLHNLESLSLRFTRITDVGLTHVSRLASLKQLSLAGNAITDAGLNHLKALHRLERLDLSSTAVRQNGIRELNSLPKLTTLSLRDTQIGDAVAPSLITLDQLTSLDLGDTALTDAGLAQIVAMEKLASLGLGGTKVTDDGLKNLIHLGKLTALNLENTGITDAGLVHLRPLISLRRLNLSGTKIDDASLELLAFLSWLTELEVRNTPVTSFDIYRVLPQTNGNVNRILAALDENTTLDFVEQPIYEVVNYLMQRHQIKILVDIRSFAEANIAGNLPITFHYRDGTLGEALKLLLAKYDLDMAIRYELLLIGAKPMPAGHPGLPVLPFGAKLSPKLGTALGEQTEFRFIDAQFPSVMEYFSKRHGIEIALDREALAKVGIGDDVPITKEVHGISLKAALELVFSDLDLTCYVEGDRLVVRPLP